jgi:hypothetical protein
VVAGPADDLGHEPSYTWEQFARVRDTLGQAILAGAGAALSARALTYTVSLGRYA